MADGTPVVPTTPAPAVDAKATPAATSAAPVTGDAAKAATVAEAAANATPDQRAAFNEFLKTQPMTIKAGGKQHRITSLEQFERYAQRGIPVEENLQQLSKMREEIQPTAQLLSRLKDAEPDEVEGILEQLVDSGKLTAIAEKRLLRQLEAEKKTEGMSEGERRMARELESLRAEKQRFEAERQQRAQTERQQQEEAQANYYRQQIGSTVVEALKLMDLPPELNANAVEFMKPMLRQLIDNGVEINPQLLAERARPFFEKVNSWTKRGLESLDGEALLAALGPNGEKRVRQAILAKLQAAQPNGTPKPNQDRLQTPVPVKWDPRSMR